MISMTMHSYAGPYDHWVLNQYQFICYVSLFLQVKAAAFKFNSLGLQILRRPPWLVGTPVVRLRGHGSWRSGAPLAARCACGGDALGCVRCRCSSASC